MSSREVDIGSSSANPNKEMTEKTNHESDNVNDGVSFLLEEPRSSLKKGFNIEVRLFTFKFSDITNKSDIKLFLSKLSNYLVIRCVQYTQCLLFKLK